MSSPTDETSVRHNTGQSGKTGLLNAPLPLLDDAEGSCLPDSLPFTVDAHVHFFPDDLFAAVWQWFDQFGWPIRYRLTAPEIIEFLFGRGIDHIVALHYAHKPGIARQLNSYMAELSRSNPRVTALATVFPGEKGTSEILMEAFESGLKGVKLHSHVQCFDMHSEPMHEIYQLCSTHHQPLIMHVGREPKSPAYPCDPYLLCDAKRLEGVLRQHPGLKVCVPHLGADEFGAYRNLIEKYENLWLDTTMMLADYLPMGYVPDLTAMRSDRIMFGTDFPNLPYAWDREIKRLSALKLDDDVLEKILGGNAGEFYGIVGNEGS